MHTHLHSKHVHEIDCQVLMVPTATCVLHKMYPFSLFMLHQSVTIYFVFYCKLTNFVVTIKTKTHGHANLSSGNNMEFAI